MAIRNTTCALLLAISAACAAQPPKSLMVDSTVGRYVGLPIHWGHLDAALLETSGRIRLFEQQEILRHQLLDEHFQPVSLSEARTQLQNELGPAYETAVMGPYVIATPIGQASRWESRFRTLLAGYTRYFETRGLKLRKPDFPLVVIVTPDRREFSKFASKESSGVALGANLAGMYVPRSNRCILFNLAVAGSTDWHATEATIVHEAVHQLAYNTGVHERLFSHPLWFVEGLATMFEVPAVYDDSAARAGTIDRIYLSRAAEVFNLVDHDSASLAQLLDDLISGDHLFRSHPREAYALAWAMTFYLSERMGKQYFDYISLQRQRGFEPYSSENRQLDFRRAFNSSPQQLAPHILQIIKQ